jgi:hypothetical protein
MLLFACACAHPPEAQHADTPEPARAKERDAATEPEHVALDALDAPERSRPPSTASYEQAMSTPEVLDINDDTPHLTDLQLSGPIRGALTGCQVPSNDKVMIKTAVQLGRAIGVTVDVRVVRPKSARPLSRAAARAQAQITSKIAACVDHNVRAIVWPPSRRRDSSMTEF